MTRSLKASQEGIAKAKPALIEHFRTQQKLADSLGVTRQPISKFFNCKPVDNDLFVRICEKLHLNWQEIAGNEQIDIKPTTENDIEIDNLVQQIRAQVKPHIKEKCGTMRVLDMEQPIELTGERGIYTNVNILEKLTKNRRLEIAELLQNCNYEEFERFGLNTINEERVPGLEAVKRHSKLMVLGKPGAGKTTFLKYLAMYSLEGDTFTNLVPFFITLKEFAEKPKQPDLLEYFAQQLSTCNVKESAKLIDQILRQGKALILLDGLDEVREEDRKRILRQIREICDYRNNQFVITCRIAANDYVFQDFTDVEVSDFDNDQIKFFVNQWFINKNPAKADKCFQKLEENPPIKELANNPLLLTLLCLIFEEKGKFHNTRYDLYEEGIELLLEKWDASRDIERNEIYKNLSTRRKEDLLSKIAMTTFETGNYFFKTSDVEKLIAEYIYNLLNYKTKEDIFNIESKKVLKLIVSQHGLILERATGGIYSFSHLTFHEYFVAREIYDNSAWDILVEHITENRWREVFMLTVERMKNADILLLKMKQKVDDLISNDNQLQTFLKWVNDKASSIKFQGKLASIRALYLGLESIFYNNYQTGYINLSINDTMLRILDLDPYDRKFKIKNDLIFDFHLYAVYATVNHNLFIYRSGRTSFLVGSDVHSLLRDTPDYSTELSFKNLLKNLLDKIPENKEQSWIKMSDNYTFVLTTFRETFSEWWHLNGKNWLKKLRNAMIKYRNIGQDWQFNDVQKELLKQYSNANSTLIECLDSDCYVSREVRQEIEDTLFLPMSEIEKRKKQPENK